MTTAETNATDKAAAVAAQGAHVSAEKTPATKAASQKKGANGGGVESGIRAAAREAMEEVGIDLGQAHSILIGSRNMDRPFDVRVAANDGLKEKCGIESGDIFMVSTQAVRFDVPDLAHTSLTAGDDAAPGSARRVRIHSVTRDAVGVPDHFDMIMAAVAATNTGEHP